MYTEIMEKRKMKRMMKMKSSLHKTRQKLHHLDLTEQAVNIPLVVEVCACSTDPQDQPDAEREECHLVRKCASVSLLATLPNYQTLIN